MVLFIVRARSYCLSRVHSLFERDKPHTPVATHFRAVAAQGRNENWDAKHSFPCLTYMR